MCLKFPSSCRQAVWIVLHTACLLWLETPNTVVQPLLGSYQKKNFGGCSQRLTQKDFTKGSCICDVLLRNTHANLHPASRLSIVFIWLDLKGASVSCKYGNYKVRDTKYTQKFYITPSDKQNIGAQAAVQCVYRSDVLVTARHTRRISAASGGNYVKLCNN